MFEVPRPRFRMLALALAGVAAAASATVVVAAGGASAASTTISLVPTADTYANAGAPSTNYGTKASLSSRGTPGAVAYLRFALPTAPEGLRLGAARLVLTTSADPTAASADAHLVSLGDDSWDESTLTWNAHPAAGAQVLGALSGATALSTAYPVPLDASALSPLLGTRASLSLSSSGSDGLYVYSANYPGASGRPRLELTFVDDGAPSGSSSPPVTSATPAPVPTGPVTVATDYTDALSPVAGPTTTWWTGTTSSLPDAVRISPADSRLAYRGATGFAFGTGNEDGNVWAPNSKYPNTWNSQATWSLDLVTDASVVEVVYKQRSGSAYRVVVDGHVVTELPQPLPFASAGRTGILRLDFGTSASRRITLDLASAKFVGLNVPATARLTRPDPYAVRWVVLGDSISGGSGQNTAFAQGTWVNRTARLLGWDDPYLAVSGGSGYVNPGQSVKFGDRLSRDVIDVNPQTVVLFGGYNDVLSSKEQIAAEASAVMARIRVALPGTTVYVVGCWSPRGTPATQWADTNTVLATIAREGHAPFVSVLDGKLYDASGKLVAAQGSWITGTGRLGSPTGNGNADRYIGKDGVHPTDAGHAYLGRRMAEALALLTPDAKVPGTVTLSWPPVAGATGYAVHRSTAPGFVPGADTLLATTTATRWADTPGGRGRYYYAVLPVVQGRSGSEALVSGPVAFPDPDWATVSDVTSPTRPGEMAAAAATTGVTLTWTASTDDVGVVLYEVHRSTAAGFIPSAATLVGLTSTPAFADPAGTAGAVYEVVAVDGAGNRGTASEVDVAVP